MRELRYNQLSFFGEFEKFVPYCWRFTTQASSTFLAFVILLLKPLRSFFFIFFFLIYFNYLVLVFYIPQKETYCHHYFDILSSLFYLLKQVKQFLAPRSNKSEQHNFLKISLIIMHRPWEYREKVDDPKQNRHRSVFWRRHPISITGRINKLSWKKCKEHRPPQHNLKTISFVLYHSALVSSNWLVSRALSNSSDHNQQQQQQ